jgi:hypothetical protein
LIAAFIATPAPPIAQNLNDQEQGDAPECEFEQPTDHAKDDA